MLMRLLRFLFGFSKPPSPEEIRARLEEAPSSLAGRDLSQPASVQSRVSQPSASPSDNTTAAVTQPSNAALNTVPGRPGNSGSSLTGLKTDKFAPISIDEALSATAKTDWQSAYYD